MFILPIIFLIFVCTAQNAQSKTRTEVWDNHSMSYKYTLWKSWQNIYEKEYVLGSSQHDARFEIFLNNCKSVAELNDKHFPETQFALNEYTDLTFEEFKLLKGIKPIILKDGGSNTNTNSSSNIPSTTISETPSPMKYNGDLDKLHYKKKFPHKINWAQYGILNPVADQLDCGGCFSFASTATIESRCAIAGHPLRELSKQHIIDCSVPYGNGGCGGGNMGNSYAYVFDNGGVCLESAYPYENENNTCAQNECTKYGQIQGFTRIRQNDEKRLAYHVSKGPVSIGIEATWEIQHYSSGIFSVECGYSLDHAVVVVGYGSKNGEQYWKIRNSWGPEWGEEGYFRICRNCKPKTVAPFGQCGITRLASYPICEKPIIDESELASSGLLKSRKTKKELSDARAPQANIIKFPLVN